MSLCGFPEATTGLDLLGVLTGGFHPRATCLTGTVSALRPFDPGESATPENTQLIQYDLPVTPGTSGSAVFNDAGQVVGVNSFGLFESGGDLNFAIRSDKLEELIEWVSDGAMTCTDLILPDSGPAPLPSGACNTSYYNEEWRFGSDVPAGFEGPEVVPSTLWFEVEFVPADSEYISIKASVYMSLFDLDDTVESSIAIRTEDGTMQLLDQEEFVTANGAPAYLLWWRFPDPFGELWLDTHSVESWTLGEFGAYVVKGQAFHDDYVALEPTLEATAPSICTD